MKHILLELENLDCEGCANSIRRVLLRQPGVLSVHVELKIPRVHISCEDDLDSSHIISVLENLGYPAFGKNSMLHIARARLSCQLGKIRHQTYYHPILS